MSFNLPGEVNPFEAPGAGIGEEALYLDLPDNDAELIRREHIGRESNIKSLGHLNYFGTFVFGLCTILMIVMAAGGIPAPPNQRQPMDPMMQRVIGGFGALFYLVPCSICAALGYGLTHLQVWARWTAVGVSSLGMLIFAFYCVVIAVAFNPTVGLSILAALGGFYGVILYMLVSSKSGVVFSSEYREVIRKTPHVRLKTSILVKILAIVLVLALVLAVVGFFMNRPGG